MVVVVVLQRERCSAKDARNAPSSFALLRCLAVEQRRNTRPLVLACVRHVPHRRGGEREGEQRQREATTVMCDWGSQEYHLNTSIDGSNNSQLQHVSSQDTVVASHCSVCAPTSTSWPSNVTPWPSEPCKGCPRDTQCQLTNGGEVEHTTRQRTCVHACRVCRKANKRGEKVNEPYFITAALRISSSVFFHTPPAKSARSGDEAGAGE